MSAPLLHWTEVVERRAELNALQAEFWSLRAERDRLLRKCLYADPRSERRRRRDDRIRAITTRMLEIERDWT